MSLLFVYVCLCITCFFFLFFRYLIYLPFTFLSRSKRVTEVGSFSREFSRYYTIIRDGNGVELFCNEKPQGRRKTEKEIKVIINSIPEGCNSKQQCL